MSPHANGTESLMHEAELYEPTGVKSRQEWGKAFNLRSEQVHRKHRRLVSSLLRYSPAMGTFLDRLVILFLFLSSALNALGKMVFIPWASFQCFTCLGRPGGVSDRLVGGIFKGATTCQNSQYMCWWSQLFNRMFSDGVQSNSLLADFNGAISFFWS